MSDQENRETAEDSEGQMKRHLEDEDAEAMREDLGVEIHPMRRHRELILLGREGAAFPGKADFAEHDQLGRPTERRPQEVTDGTLYPVLYRLERGRYVAVRWETPERGVPRKYYRLTDRGRDELERLTHEWTSFAKAMSKLLRQSREG